MTNQEVGKESALFEDLTLMSIFEHYLDERLLENEDEEDIVLAALAILAEDDRESRGIAMESDDEKHQIHGAAVAGGLTGLALLGPIGAFAGAGWVALAAAKSHGFAGDVARDMGNSVLAMSDLVASRVTKS
jgi:hypothetical protein